jgi:hypothetical protein
VDDEQDSLALNIIKNKFFSNVLSIQAQYINNIGDKKMTSFDEKIVKKRRHNQLRWHGT